MTTTTDTLAAFVGRMLDADEAAARAAMGPDATDASGHWVFSEIPYEGVFPEDPDNRIASLDADLPWALHANRHDPARVLAQVAAIRRIVELHYSWNLQAEQHPEPPFGPILKTQVTTAETILRALASIWKDAPGFDAGWAAV